MTENDFNIKRAFTGFKDTGEEFVILYTDSGVKWLTGEKAEPYFNGVSAVSSPSGNSPGFFNTASSFLGSFASATNSVLEIANTITNLQNSIQNQQYRLLEEAKFEEERRIPWLINMINRWTNTHQNNNGVDLLLSHYLSKEVQAAIKPMSDNPKMSLPQSLLFDLERIRQVIASVRRLTARQFMILEESSNATISNDENPTFEKSVLNLIKINYEYIKMLSKDPTEDWEGFLEKEIDLFSGKAFWINAFPDLNSEYFQKDRKQNFSEIIKDPQLIMSLISILTIPARSTPAGPALAGIAALMPFLSNFLKQSKEKELLNREDVNELTQFYIEIEKTRALHQLWTMLDKAISYYRGGNGFLVLEDHGRMIVAEPFVAPSNQITYEPIAIEKQNNVPLLM